ncbi:MAG TPA: hypothetical protein PKZ72_01985 [Saprospiraceae bacterium]|nr:hypothetical protein [Saprospiraceae bacterium]
MVKPPPETITALPPIITNRQCAQPQIPFLSSSSGRTPVGSGYPPYFVPASIPYAFHSVRNLNIQNKIIKAT